MSANTLTELIDHHENEILNEWVRKQLESLISRRDLISDAELRADSRNMLSALRDALAAGGNSGGLSSRMDEVAMGGVISPAERKGAGALLSVEHLSEPLLIAHMAACVRLTTPILRRTALTWTLTVVSAIPRSRPMALF